MSDGANTSDIVKRSPECANKIGEGYTFSETRDGNIMILTYGPDGLLSIVELQLDEVFDYLNRLEVMANDMAGRE